MNLRESEAVLHEQECSVADSELVRRAKDGDRRATDELFARHYQKAYALAHSLCSGDREAAKDVTQDAFIKAFQNIDKFEERAAFSSWLFKIIVNTSTDRKRGMSRRRRFFTLWRSSRSEGNPPLGQLELEDNRDESSPLHILENKEKGERIRDAIMDLPGYQRVAFHLKVVEGMKVKEIAQIMGAAEGTVKTHLFRAIHSLRESLEDLTVL